MVEHLYKMAADFYRLAPWRWLTDMHPIEIRYPDTAPPRFAVVMGNEGKVFGLSVYDTIDDFRKAFIATSAEQINKLITWFALHFDEAIEMTSFEDLEAKDKFGWPIASEQAYPAFVRTTHKGGFALPEKADIFWAEGALAAILAYFEKHWKGEQHLTSQFEITLMISTISQEEKAYLRIPAIDEDELDDLLLEVA